MRNHNFKQKSNAMGEISVELGSWHPLLRFIRECANNFVLRVSEINLGARARGGWDLERSGRRWEWVGRLEREGGVWVLGFDVG